jgi:hypothetical protein
MKSHGQFQPPARGADKTSKGSLGCLLVFLAPFFLAGLFFLGIGLKHLVQGQSREGLPLAGIATVFLLGAGGFLAIGLGSVRQAKEQERTRATNPDKPWLWRKDWASGVIESGAVAGMVVAWVFSLFWNALSWPFLFLAFPKELARGNYIILIFLLFPVIGLGLLWWAVYATLQWRKFGRSKFHLSSVPGVLGGALAGFVEIPAKVLAEKGYKLRLWCVRRTVTGSGKNRSTHEDLLWEDTKVILRDSLQHERERTGVPVHFNIPYELPASEGGNPAIVWRLEITADIPGVDYHAQFEVPVFKTEASTADAPPVKDPTAAFQPPPAPFAPPANTRIRVRDLADGVEVYFPAARGVVGIAILFGFAVVWNLFLWLMIAKKAPVFFPIIWGLFDALILLLLASALLHSVRVVARRSGIEIFHRMVIPTCTRRLSWSDIHEVKTRVESHAGAKVWYGLVISTHYGREYSAGGGIADKGHAEWLAEKVRCWAGH